MAIPTFRPGETTEVNLSSVRKFEPAGDRAAAQMWNDVANEMGRVVQTYNEIETNKALDRAQNEGIIAASQPGYDPQELNREAVTAADRAYRKGATAAYLSQLDMQTDQALTRINAESLDDPEVLRERMSAHIEMVSSQMPPVVAVQFKEAAASQANAYYTNSLSSQASKARTMQKTDVMAGLELSEARLAELGIPDNPQAEQQASLEGAKYKVKLQAAIEAGFLSPNEAALRTQDLQEKLLDSTIYKAVYSSPDRLNFAMKVANGESGTDLDALPVAKRYRAVTVAQQMINADEAAERLRNEQIRTQVNAQMLDISRNVFAAPQSEQAQAQIQKALTIANTPDAVDLAYKLQNYSAAPDAERFRPINGEYQAHLEYRAARGDLRQSDVNSAFGAEQPNSRIGADGWQKLTTELGSKPDKLVGSNAWDVFVARLESEFPVPQRSSVGLAALAAKLNLPANSINLIDGTDGVGDKQKQENRSLITQVLRDTQQQIAAGVIDSESSLTNYGTKKLGELRQQYGAGSLNPANKVKPRGPQQQAAWVVVGSDENARRMYEKYKDDREGFMRDLNAGKIDRRTANTINRLMKEGK